jgi:hypothetical protein
MNLRTLSRIVLLIAILAFPFWIYLPLLVIAVLFFPFYIEGVIGGFLIDVLYSNAPIYIGFSFPFALIMAVVLVISLPLRDYIRVGNV